MLSWVWLQCSCYIPEEFPIIKLLYVTLEPPLAENEIATGNAVRTAQLYQALDKQAIEVIQIWQVLDQAGQAAQRTFVNAEDLRDLIDHHQPSAVLIGYWGLLKFLPFEIQQPIVLDFVAPRPLEVLFELPDQLQQELQELKTQLAKADFFLVGNERQKHLFIPLLMQAGLDIRQHQLVVSLPLAAQPSVKLGKQGVQAPFRLVGGGVNWPWRNAQPYWRAYHDWCCKTDHNPVELTLFGGAYPDKLYPRKDLGNAAAELGSIDYRPLTEYHRYSRFLDQQAHIGLELAEENLERYYSQSFRSLEFLRHGLPIICNEYLSLAKWIKQHDAGWTVNSPAEFIALMPTISADQIAQKSQNALGLLSTELNPDHLIQPLVEFLEAPFKTARLPTSRANTNNNAQPIPQLAELPPAERKIKRRQLFQRRFPGLMARLRGEQPWFKRSTANTGAKPIRHKDAVVIVTRKDIFPTDHGAAVKIIQTARGLSKTGRDVAIVTDDRKQYYWFKDGEYSIHKYPFWLRLLALPQNLTKARHYSKDIPEQDAFLYLPLSDRSYNWRTIYVGKKIRAGVFQAEFPAYARACIWGRTVLGGKVVIVEHNVEYNRIYQQTEGVTQEQYANLKAIEISLCNQSDAVICVSDNDRQTLADDGVDPTRLFTIPHGVDLDQFKRLPAVDARNKFGIPATAGLLVYHGIYMYPPNLEAIKLMAEEILPRLEHAGLDCHVLAIGRHPPPEALHPRVHFTDSVEHVAEWIKAADIAVVPLVDGGGTRMKIIDYFAAKIPVVSTSKGIEGIPARHGHSALIIDDWADMAAAIQRLLTQPSEAAAIGQAGFDIAESLDWSALAYNYVDVFRQIGAPFSETVIDQS